MKKQYNPLELEILRLGVYDLTNNDVSGLGPGFVDDESRPDDGGFDAENG